MYFSPYRPTWHTVLFAESEQDEQRDGISVGNSTRVFVEGTCIYHTEFLYCQRFLSLPFWSVTWYVLETGERRLQSASPFCVPVVPINVRNDFAVAPHWLQPPKRRVGRTAGPGPGGGAPAIVEAIADGVVDERVDEEPSVDESTSDDPALPPADALEDSELFDVALRAIAAGIGGDHEDDFDSVASVLGSFDPEIL